MASNMWNMADRAKIFAPFDALKGFREALAGKERITVPRPELSEETRDELDRRIRQIRRNDMITAVYYCKGEYVRCTGMFSRLDETRRILTLVHRDIPLDDLCGLEIVSPNYDSHSAGGACT